MAAPTYVRTVAVDNGDPPATAGVATTVAWGTPPGAGNRLFLIITHNDQTVVSNESVVGSGWLKVNPPGLVNRINTILGIIYEKLSAAGDTTDDVTVAMDRAVSATFQLVEWSGADSGTPSDVTGLNFGSAQTLPVTASTPTSRDDVAYMAVMASGHVHPHSNPLPAGSTLQNDHPTPGADSGAKLRTAVVTKVAGTHPETVTMSVDVSSGGGTPFNHNFVSLLIGIPGVAGALPNPGAAFGLPDTNDGKIHRSCRGDYYPQGFSPGSTTVAQATANAQKLAALIDLMVTNVGEDPTTAKITGDKYEANTAAMHAAHPDVGGLGLRLGTYNKGYVIVGASKYPANYYAHTTSFPGGPIILVFGNNKYLAMPFWASQSSFVDPRGWTAHSFREQQARDCWAIIARYNAVYGANQLKVVLLDSMNLYKTNIDPTTGANYVNKDDFVKTLGWTVGDETMTRRIAASYMVLVNGLVNGPKYFPYGQQLLAHADGGVAEEWLRNNFDPPTSFPSVVDWNDSIDMLWDANVNLGKVIWSTVNINNQTAGTNTNPPSFTTQQLAQQRRFSMSSYMIGKRTSSFFEFVEDVTLSPWLEDHPYYHVDLGLPLENGKPSVVSLRIPYPGQAVGINQRNFTQGAVFCNPTNSPITFAFDRDYKDPVGAGVAHYGAGTQFTLSAHDGLIVLLDAPQIPNASAPATAWSASMPVISKTAGFVLQATAADPDGIASAEFQLNGGAWQAAAFGNGIWSLPVTLVSGANSAAFRATDGNNAPLTSTPINISITYTPNSGPPSASFNNPPASVSSSPQLAQVTASDADGIAGVTLAVNDSTQSQPMVFNGSSGKWELAVALPLNVNTLYAVVTDLHPEPQSRTITMTVTVTTTPPDTGGGGGTTDPGDTTDIAQGSFASYVYDDLATMDFT